MSVTGTAFAERKLAGRALMKEILTLVQLQQEGDTIIAGIGGFDLEFSGECFGRDEYRYTTVLKRTGADYEIELPVTVTPLGAIARLEHALSNFEGEQDDYRRRREDASRRLASYRPRIGEAFAFEAELELKREQLVDLEADLATSTDDSPGFVVGVADGGTRQAA